MNCKYCLKYILMLFLFFSASLLFPDEDFSRICSDLFKYVKVPVLVIDPDTSLIVDANNTAAEFYGYGYDRLRGMPVSSINLLSDREVEHEIRNASSEKRNYFIFRHRLSSGEIKDVEVYSSPVEYNNKKYLVSIIHDISDKTRAVSLLAERSRYFFVLLITAIIMQSVFIVFYIRVNRIKKTVQASLREKSKEFDRFFSIKSDLLCVINKKGEFLKVNQACRPILDINCEDIRKINIFSILENEDIGIFREALVEADRREGVSASAEVKLKETEKYTEWKISRYGKLYYAIARDITERKKNSEKHLEMEKQILQTQKLESLGVLAGGIAHDFNNILMAILGHTELARMEINNFSPACSNLKEIETASKKASKLCNQMLTYTGRASFALEKVNINRLIEEMIHLIKTLISKKAVLNLSLAEKISDINGDPSQISQVIMNLIINSSDAIGEKNGVISISTGSSFFDSDYLSKTDLYDEIEPGKYVYFEISDTGCGLSPDMKERIFEPFYTTKFTGRGLGLSAVHGIVRSHKGAIKVYSEKGKGSSFKVMFPASDAREEYITENEMKENNENWNGSGTVLFVDDEDTLRFLGSNMLKKLGFNVITAEDGLEAVEIFRKRRGEIDLVILDLTMPNMDGSQALSEIRNIDENMKVVIASGYSYNDVIARFSGKNLAGIIQKPYSMDKIKEILQKI